MNNSLSMYMLFALCIAASLCAPRLRSMADVYFCENRNTPRLIAFVQSFLCIFAVYSVIKGFTNAY